MAEGGNAEIDGASLYFGPPSFGPVFRVDDDTSGSWQDLPAVAIDSNGIAHTIWADMRSGRTDVRYSVLECCAPNTSLLASVVGEGFQRPSPDGLAVGPDGTVHVAWDDNSLGTDDVVYASKGPTDSGFAPPIPVHPLGPGREGHDSLTLAGDGGVVVAYNGCPVDDPAKCDIFVTKRMPNGTFAAPIKVNDDTGSSSQFEPSIAAFGDEVYIAWTDEREGSLDIYYTVVNLTTGSVGPNLRVNRAASQQQDNPDVAVDPRGDVLVVWTDGRTGSDGDDVYGAIRASGASEFTPEFRVNDNVTGGQRGPIAAPLGPESFFVVWSDFRNRDFDIYGARIVRGTAERSAEITDPESELAEYPAVAAGSGSVAVVWRDRRSGDGDIYGSSGTVGGAYTWDVRPGLDSDGNGNSTDDIDFSGRMLSTPFGDDGTYEVVLNVRGDGRIVFSARVPVQVSNAAPLIDADLTQTGGPVHLTLVVSGEKWHDVSVTVLRHATVVGGGRLVRTPGNPNDQALDLGTYAPWSAGEVQVIVVYTPEDDPPNGQTWGATPARLVLGDLEDPLMTLHHTFNARRPETWEWRVAPALPSGSGGWRLSVRLRDPGSDDLFLDVDWGDGAMQRLESLNDPAHPDPPLSPDVSPRDVEFTLEHAYSPGTYALAISAMDDDGGISSLTLNITVP